MFAFNFLPDAGEEPPNDETTLLHTASTAPSQPNDVSHPFAWKENLESLLESRAQQEIIFQEIDLTLACDAAIAANATTATPNYDTSETTTTTTNTTTTTEPLRRVCMDPYELNVTPGVYEGGLQVWECSLDLVRYFQEHKEDWWFIPQHDQHQDHPSPSKRFPASVLELGCGHALPGCWLLREALRHKQQQPISVALVDYNDYVVEDVTLSNVVLNTAGIIEAQELAQRNWVQLGAGDWHDMSRQMPDRRFDWIVAAETTYTPEASNDTAVLLLRHLTVETGIGWVASKRYYFGVGGGTDALREAAQTLSQAADSPHYLNVETVRVFDNGVGNIREILKITCHAKEG